MKEILEPLTFHNMLNALNTILGISRTQYNIELNDNEDLRAGFDFKTLTVTVSYLLWYMFVYETDKIVQKENYAICVAVIGHELMHVRQFYLSDLKRQYLSDFLVEGNLPENTDEWTENDYVVYYNLVIEIEAYAFRMLLEKTLLNGSDDTFKVPDKIDKEKYKCIYDEVEKEFKSRIEFYFKNIINLDYHSNDN